MASPARPSAAHGGGVAPFPMVAQLPTGGKLFVALSVGLLPLALIGLFATLQTRELAEAEAQNRLALASGRGAHAIATELVNGVAGLSAAAAALGPGAVDPAGCARAQQAFALQQQPGVSFAVADRAGATICGDAFAVPAASTESRAITAAAAADGLVLTLQPPHARWAARALVGRSTLIALARPTGLGSAYGGGLIVRGGALPLAATPGAGLHDRVSLVRTDLDLAGVELDATARQQPISYPLIVMTLLPLLMWAAAAAIAWFVVDRLLIEPLRRLRRSVAAFTPGEVIDVGASGPLPASEIRELGETFRAISRTVAIHEAGLAEGLVRQTKLTREVHHRVKNNLQVISSLINFHARGAASADASAAYASIQRRVDALAVVHRNHFAEMEDNRGLNVRTLLGELAANIRATAPAASHGLGITLDVEPAMVNQDVAVAVAFLVTESIELAMSVDPRAQIRIAVSANEAGDRATLRVVSRALIETDQFRALAQNRYARVMEGLARQLRAPLHHDPLTGAYEIAFPLVGRA